MEANEMPSDVISATRRRVSNPRSPKYRTVQRERKSPVGVRSGSRTGTTTHFKMWMADLRIKSTLQRLKTSTLADQTEGEVASGFAVLSVSGVKNVWAVTQMQVSSPAFGKLTIGQIDAVAKYLKGKNVIVGWAAE